MVFARVGVYINYPMGDTGLIFRTQLVCKLTGLGFGMVSVIQFELDLKSFI